MISLLEQERRIGVQRVDDAGAVRKVMHDFRLARGEAEALWLARNCRCPVALDNGPAIKAAKVLGLQFLTAIHFLFDLVARNALSSGLAQEKLAKLAHYGRHNKRIVEDAATRLREGRK